MSIRFRCPFCKKPLKLVNTEKLGQPLQCPNPVCKKWIVFNDQGVPQDTEGSSAVSQSPTKPQPGPWLSVDGIEDEGQLRKVKRNPNPNPQPPPLISTAIPRGRVFDHGESGVVPAYDDDEDGSQGQPPPPPLPNRGPSFVEDDGPPPVPPRSYRSNRPMPVFGEMPRSGAARMPGKPGTPQLLIAILCLGIIGIGVAGYFVLMKESGPVFVPQPYGVIELSTTGIKAIVVTPFQDEVGRYDFSVPKEFEPLNVSPGSLVDGGKSLDPKTLEKSKIAVKDCLDAMQSAPYNIPKERIAIIRSSGVLAVFKDLETFEKNRKLVDDALEEVTGIKPDGFKPTDEAKYVARFIIPSSELATAMLIDIGSGNIKGGYFNSDNLFLSTDVDTGTKRFADSVKDAVKTSKGDFQTTAQELSVPQILDRLKNDIENTPGLSKRPTIYLTGGIAWVLKTYIHPEVPVKELYVDITPEDIEKYRKLITETPEKDLQTTILATVKGEQQREEIKKELDNIEKIFPIERRKGGAEILGRVSEAYDFANKKVMIYTKGHFAPSLGYVLYKLNIVQ
jgi:hypothetical protein